MCHHPRSPSPISSDDALAGDLLGRQDRVHGARVRGPGRVRARRGRVPAARHRHVGGRHRRAAAAAALRRHVPPAARQDAAGGDTNIYIDPLQISLDAIENLLFENLIILDNEVSIVPSLEDTISRWLRLNGVNIYSRRY